MQDYYQSYQQRGDPYAQREIAPPAPAYHSPSSSPSYRDASPRSNHPASHPDSGFSLSRKQQQLQQQQDAHYAHANQTNNYYNNSSSNNNNNNYQYDNSYYDNGNSSSNNNYYSSHSGSASPYDSLQRGAPNPSHQNDGAYYQSREPPQSTGGYAYQQPATAWDPISSGADYFGPSASADLAYDVADRNPPSFSRGMEPYSTGGQVPPPPSRSQYPPSPQYSGSGDGYGYDQGYYPPESGYGHNPGGYDSHSNLTGDSPYQGYSTRSGGPNLGVVNPNEIEDDGDDGLNYHKSQRNSMLSLPHSDRGAKRAAATSTAAVGTGAAAGGLLANQGGEKSSDWLEKNQRGNKRWKWLIILLVSLVIIGAIVGGVVGGMINNGHKSSSDSSHGDTKSAKADEKENGDLNINSKEIKALMNNPDLHKVFPGMDYTPLNTQYPGCVKNPPSQNNITRDVAVLSQLTNKIRLYGTDCNQTEMVIHAIKQLQLQDTIKIWLGVWQDNNKTTNARQLKQMWNILDDYGGDHFEGVIVANEILFRKQMTESQLGSLLSEVRSGLKQRNINLKVGTSDLGDDWTSALAQDSDYVMANIHPFFAGVTAKEAASWTYTFWSGNDGKYWKSDKSHNIISETGWPSQGGTDCGTGSSTCSGGSVAGIDELNTFMEGWVCDALKNGTQYFWFEAFDEPWKIAYDTKKENWEDHWGLMTVDRELKKGVKIPDCGGKTVA